MPFRGACLSSQVPDDEILQGIFPHMITAVSTGGSGGEDRLTENVTLNFAKIEWSYTPQSEKGAAGNPMPGGWNVAENVKV